MASQTINLGQFNISDNANLATFRLIDTSLVNNGAVAWLGFIQVQFIGSISADFNIRISPSQFGDPGASGQDLTDTWEVSAVAVTLQNAAAGTIVVKGPNHADSNNMDPAEPYAWQPETILTLELGLVWLETMVTLHLPWMMVPLPSPKPPQSRLTIRLSTSWISERTPFLAFPAEY